MDEMLSKNEKQLSIFTETKGLLRLAVPLLITGFFQSSTGFLENVFLARLGQESMAAGALVSWLFFIVINWVFGLLNAVNILIAHKHGEGDKKGIAHVLHDGFFLAAVLTVLSGFILWNIAPIYGWLGQKDSLVHLVALYLHALVFALPAKFTLMVLFEFIIGLG